MAVRHRHRSGGALGAVERCSAGLAGSALFCALPRLPRFALRWRAVRALARCRQARAQSAVPPALRGACGRAVDHELPRFRSHRVCHRARDANRCYGPRLYVARSAGNSGDRYCRFDRRLGFARRRHGRGFRLHQRPGGAAFAMSVLFGLTLAAASLPGSLLWWLSGYSAKASTAARHPVVS